MTAAFLPSTFALPDQRIAAAQVIGYPLDLFDAVCALLVCQDAKHALANILEANDTPHRIYPQGGGLAVMIERGALGNWWWRPGLLTAVD